MSFDGAWRRVGGWSRRAAIGLAVAVVLAVLTIRAPDEQRWQSLHQASDLLLAGGLVASGVLFYSHWLVTRWSSSSWLALATCAVGSYLGLTGLLLTSSASEPSGVQPVGFALLMLVIGLLAPRQPRQDRSVRPMLLGGLAGSATALVVEVTPAWDVARTTFSVPGIAVVVATAACGLFLTWSVLTGVGAPLWVRGRIAVVTMLVAAAESIVRTPEPWLAIGAATAKVVAAAVLLETARRVADVSIADLRRAIDNLRHGLERQEFAAREERATLHEVRSALSGVAQAITLLDDSGLSQERRTRLQDMVTSELARLERMVDRGRSGPTGPVDLDRVLERVILRQRVRGQRVLWQPSGHTPVVQPDSLTEILSILLENSRRHASGATTVVEVQRDSEELEIVLSDTGRGVPGHLRNEIFHWGVRASGSPGQGIGLSVARDLARQNGGELALADSGGGATFVLTLPARSADPRLSADRGDWDDAFSA